MSTLEVRNLVQRYSYGAYGVNDISFKTNGILSILGETSSGKTSLLKCIAGLYLAKSGEIYLNGFNIQMEEPKNRHLQLISADEGFFKRKSVFYNLYYPLKIRGVKESDALPLIEDAAEKLGLAHLLHQKFFLLDAEERAKTAFARSMVRKADLVLFDDILKHVRGRKRRELFLFLVPFIKKLDAVVLFATSSADEAFTIGHETLVLSCGYMLDIGNKEALLKNAKTLRSYRYAAADAANLVKGTLIKEDSGISINILGQHLPLDSDKLLSDIYLDGGEVTAVFLLKKDNNGTFRPFEDGFVEYTGGCKILHAFIDGVMLSLPIGGGEENISCSIDIDTLRVFDTASERPIYFA